jgi:opacity protein-like surface antigen
MFVITHRSIVFSAAALFTVLTSAAAAQEAQSTSDPSQSQPAIQSDVTAGDNDDAELVLAEPDFRVLNLPSTLRLPRHGSSFQLTHRFNGNLRRGSLGGNAGNLFGLDQGAAVGFEYRFGIARHLQAAVYRTAIDKTFQFYGKYDAVRQDDSIPVSLSALVSVEGADNFQERYSPALGVAVSRIVADRLAVYATPIWVHNTAAILNTDRDTFFVGIGGRVRVSSTVYVVGEVAPRAGGYSPDKPAYGFAIEKRAGGHLFQLNFNNGQGTTFGQLARGGFPESLYLGFNLARKFF